MTTRSPGSFEEEGLPPPPPGDGATSAPPRSRRSGAWIIWVVAGVLLCAAASVLTALTPSLIAAMTTSADGPSESSTGRAVGPSAEDSGREVDDFLSPAEEQAAIETVGEHDWAWLSGDCEGYFATTTERFRRDVMSAPDCAAFAAEVRDRADTEPFTATVTKVEAIGEAIGVYTIESYVTRLDDTRDREQEPVTYVHVVVNEDGRWVIDDFFVE